MLRSIAGGGEEGVGGVGSEEAGVCVRALASVCALTGRSGRTQR